MPVFGLAKSYDANKGADPRSLGLKKMVTKLTKGDHYTHSIVSFDPTMKTMYSFEKDGFIVDSMDRDTYWMTTDAIYICVMFIKKSDRDKMEAFCKKLQDSPTDYAWSNLITAYIGTPVKQDFRHICSGFVGYIMSCANAKNLHRDYSRLRPEDITIFPRAFFVGTYRDRDDFREHYAEFCNKVKKIYKDNEEEIEDYNNYLPKMELQQQFSKLKTFDKILEWFMKKWSA